MRSGEQELVQLSEVAERNRDQEVHKHLPGEVNHHHQESSLAPPESIEESADREAELALCQTAADGTPASQSLVENSAERLSHGRLTPDSSSVSVGLSSQLEEVLHVDHPSFSNDLLVQPCLHKTEEDVKALRHKSSKMEMEMESLYPQYGPNSPPATSLTPTKVELKSEYGDAVSSCEAGTDHTKGNFTL